MNYNLVYIHNEKNTANKQNYIAPYQSLIPIFLYKLLSYCTRCTLIYAEKHSFIIETLAQQNKYLGLLCPFKKIELLAV
jgi:hypothetical protein